MFERVIGLCVEMGEGGVSLPNDYPRVLPFHAVVGWDFQRAKGLA